MASYYWIKMYHEVLHDPKMGRLTDHLWRRFFELCLICGETESDGPLPELRDLAWQLRTTDDEMLADLQQLATENLVHQDGEIWIVTKYAERQAALSPAQRKALQRERDKKQDYYGHEPVTNRDTDTDTEAESEAESEEMQKQKQMRDTERAAVVAALTDFGMGQVETVLKETSLKPTAVLETVAYAREQNLSCGLLRTMLRQNEHRRPMAPDNGRAPILCPECNQSPCKCEERA